MRNERDEFEVWNEIAGSNGAYEVSNLGQVRTMPRTVTKRGNFASYTDRAPHSRKAHTAINRGKILKPGLSKGYPGCCCGSMGKVSIDFATNS
jgi:hypothetical protein